MLKLHLKRENCLDNKYKKWHKRGNEREGNKVKIEFYRWSLFSAWNNGRRDTDSWGIVNFKFSLILIFAFVLFLIILLTWIQNHFWTSMGCKFITLRRKLQPPWKDVTLPSWRVLENDGVQTWSSHYYKQRFLSSSAHQKITCNYHLRECQSILLKAIEWLCKSSFF